MFFVHDGQANGVRASETLEMERESFWGACFLRQKKIPGRDNKRTIFAARHEYGVRIHIKARVAQLMEQRKIVKRSFGDAAFGEQAEAATASASAASSTPPAELKGGIAGKSGPLIGPAEPRE